MVGSPALPGSAGGVVEWSAIAGEASPTTASTAAADPAASVRFAMRMNSLSSSRTHAGSPPQGRETIGAPQVRRYRTAQHRMW